MMKGNKERRSKAKEEIRRILVDVAKQRRLISYLELVRKVRAFRMIPNSPQLSGLLTEISRSERAAGRGLLSAVVVKKRRKRYGIPGNGFFILVAIPELNSPNLRQYWMQELEAVYRAWSRRGSR